MLSHEREFDISVTTRTVINSVLLALVAVLAYRFIHSVTHYITIIAIGAFVALALNPFVDWMHKTIGGGRVLAVSLSFITMFLILGGFLSAVVPSLASQTVNFVSDVPVKLQSLKTEDTAVARFARQIKATDKIDNFTQDFSSHTKDIASFALNTASRITSAIASIIAVLVLAFMMLVEGPRLSRRFWELQPPKHKERYKPLVEQMYEIFTGYINGQLLISLIGAAISLALLLIVGVPNAVVLAGIIFLTGLVPLIGHPIGAAIVTLIALFSSVDKALVVGVFYIIYLQVQSATIQPYIQAKSNDMTPLMVFIAALIGIEAGGFIGAFIAIPAAGCVRILLLDYLKRHQA